MNCVALLGRCFFRPSSKLCCTILGTRPLRRYPRGRGEQSNFLRLKSDPELGLGLATIDMDVCAGACQSARALLGPDAVFSAATVAVIPLYTLMVGFPRSIAVSRLHSPKHLLHPSSQGAALTNLKYGARH